LHVAQVIQLARDHGAAGPRGPSPEHAVAQKPEPTRRQRAARATALAAVAAAGAGAIAFAASRHG
jgi:hypothetical protein